MQPWKEKGAKMEYEYLAISWLGAVTNAIEKVSTGRAMLLSCLASGRTYNKSEVFGSVLGCDIGRIAI